MGSYVQKAIQLNYLLEIYLMISLIQLPLTDTLRVPMCIQLILYICTVQAGPHLLKYLNKQISILFDIILFSTKKSTGISKFSHAGEMETLCNHHFK